MFITNPTVSIDTFNGNVICSYKGLFAIKLQHLGASNACDVAITVPYKEFRGNRLRVGDLHSVGTQVCTSNPKVMIVEHDKIKSNRSAFKDRIMFLIKKCVSNRINEICPGISIVIDRVIEEYYNAFILFEAINKGETNES